MELEESLMLLHISFKPSLTSYNSRVQTPCDFVIIIIFICSEHNINEANEEHITKPEQDSKVQNHMHVNRKKKETQFF